MIANAVTTVSLSTLLNAPSSEINLNDLLLASVNFVDFTFERIPTVPNALFSILEPSSITTLSKFVSSISELSIVTPSIVKSVLVLPASCEGIAPAPIVPFDKLTLYALAVLLMFTA